MILVDTSVWVHFLRGTDHPTRAVLRRLLDVKEDVAVTDPIVLELLAGARSESEATELRAGLLTQSFLPVLGLADFERAASIQRACRTKGATARSLLDCLIAAVAIRTDTPLLHADVDFDVIARHASLRIAPVE